MNMLLKNAFVYNKEGHIERADVWIANGRIVDISPELSIQEDAVSIFDFHNLTPPVPVIILQHLYHQISSLLFPSCYKTS